MPTEIPTIAPPQETVSTKPRAFVAVCHVVSLLMVLAIGVHWRTSTDVDFPQYYLAGVMTSEGRWAALYPDPVAGSNAHAGYPEGSALKPEFARRAAELGIPAEFRFVQAPPAALGLAPLALLPYRTAQLVWSVVSALALWGAAVISGLLYRGLVGKATRVEGLLVCGSILLPRAMLSLRLGNISPIVGFCLAAGLWAMLRRRTWSAAGCITMGLFAKYAPGVIVPIALLRRQFRPVFATMLLVCAATGLTLAFSGPGVFIEFFTKIAPTLGRPTMDWTNQTVWGVISTIPGGQSSQTTALMAARVLQWVALGAVSALLIRRRRALLTDSGAMAAALALICWLMLFGPVTWAHYAVYFVPFTGWLLHEAMQHRAAAFTITLSAMLVFIPWNVIPAPPAVHDPLTHFSLFTGTLLLGAYATTTIVRPSMAAGFAA